MANPAALTVIVILCSVWNSDAARGQSTVSPALFAGIEGSGQGALPLAAVGRHQQIHGDLSGGPRLVRALSFRRDGAAYSDARYVARTAELSVLAAEAATGAPSATFASNYGIPPVNVMPAGTVQLPDRTALPMSRPAPFDVTLPFAIPFAYSGAQDLLWEIAVTRVSSTLPYPTDRTASGSAVTYSSWIDRGGACSSVGGVFQFHVTADTTIVGQRPLVSLMYTGLGLRPMQPAAVMLGAPIPPVAVPAWCGTVMVQPLLLFSTLADPAGVFRLVDAGPLASYPVDQWFDSQAVALDTTGPGPLLAFSNAVRARIHGPVPAFPIAFVTASSATAGVGTLQQRSAVVVRLDG